MTTTAYRTCPLCEACCGLEITLEGGRVKVIRGDRADPFSRGYLCPKGTTLGRLHDDPDRLRRPLVRRDGTHVEVSWEAAFAEVARHLTPLLAKDRDSVAIYLGNPNVHNIHAAFAVRPLVQALGTRNVYSASTVDQMPKHVSAGYMFGHPLTIPVPDLDRTDHLLILGANPVVSNGSLATAPDWPGRLDALRARGGRLVVVDPRRTETADRADRWVPLRPGSDPALLLAMVNVVFADGLVDLGDAAPYVVGVDDVATAVEPFTPEAVARFTGVDPETVRMLAREFATAERAVAYGRIGTHTVPFGTLAAWAVDVLNTVTGNLDRPGGAMFPHAAHDPIRRRPRRFRTGRFRSRVRDLPEVLNELPVATLADEILTPGDGQVRALITVAGNPALTAPDGARLERALSELEFMVSVDPYLNETTRHADVVLPPPSALQRPHYDLQFQSLSVRNFARWSDPVLPLDPDHPDEFRILSRLAAIAAGMGPDTDVDALAEATLASMVQAAVADADSPVAGRDPGEILGMLEGDSPFERLFDFKVRTGHRGDGFGANPEGLTLGRLKAAPHGIDFGPLTPRLPDVVSDPDGKVRLAPPEILADLPRLRRAAESPTNGLRLVGRRQLRTANSWTHNIEVLVKGKEACTLQIHPDDAARLGLEDAAPARVQASGGTVVVPVEVTDRMMPGVVSLPYGWGHDREGTRLSVASRRPGVNMNLLTSTAEVEPLSGVAILNGIPVEVSRA